MEVLVEIADWLTETAAAVGAQSLEQGRIVFAPGPLFALIGKERRFLSPIWLDTKAKNISFDPRNGAINGTAAQGADRTELQELLGRFSANAQHLLRGLCPTYQDSVVLG